MQTVLGVVYAGLSAALELSERGERVLVLEARARVGGRTFTIQVSILSHPSVDTQQGVVLHT